MKKEVVLPIFKNLVYNILLFLLHEIIEPLNQQFR